MAVEPYMGEFHHQFPAYQSGLRKSDVVIAVNGERPDLVGRPFLVWFRTRFDPGDEVTFTVIGPDRKQRDVVFRASGNRVASSKESD